MDRLIGSSIKKNNLRASHIDSMMIENLMDRK